MATPLHLRLYQLVAVDRLRQHIRASERVVLTAPTGAGKTACAGELIDGAVQLGWRVLFLAHREELIQQASARLNAIGVHHGAIQSNRYAAQPTLPVQVASVQTLSRRHVLPPANLIIIDEAHRAMAAQYLSLLKRYPGVPVVGLTAFPERTDGRGLGDLFSALVVAARPSQLLADGFLVPVRGFAYDRPDLASVRVRSGDYDEGQLELVMGSSQIVGNVVEAWQRRAGNRRTVVFAATVKHSQALAERFRLAGAAVAHLDGSTPSDERARILAALRTGALRVVCNVDVLTEGWDLPQLEVCVIARPTLSTGRYLQMCLDAQTEILTLRGWVGPDDVKDSDKVAAFDRSTEAVSWEPILGRVDRPLAPDEAMFGISSPGVSLRLTGGHTLIYRTKTKHRGWRSADAADVAKIRLGWELPVAAVQDSPGVDLSDDELRFIGWFLTDGSLNKRTNAISIYQSINQPHFHEIEKCLKGCGLKFGKHVGWPESKFKASAPRAQFTVSKGAPIGRDKHLRGWAHLERFIDKNFSPALEAMTARQLGVLLEAMHLGDGRKYLGQGYTRRSYHIATSRKMLVDRLQSLCVRRGWRCNYSIHHYNKNPLHELHIKARPVRWVGGPCAKDRSYLARVPSVSGERVWCVENRLGTIFIRREGKVSIVGNCGRIARPACMQCGRYAHPAAESCETCGSRDIKRAGLLHDHAGCVMQHGLPDMDREFALTVGRRRAAPTAHSETLTTCAACLAIYPNLGEPCPGCGALPAPRARVLREVDGTEVPIEEVKQRPRASEAEVQAFLREQTSVARAKNYQQKWVALQVKQRFGFWPSRRQLERATG